MILSEIKGWDWGEEGAEEGWEDINIDKAIKHRDEEVLKAGTHRRGLMTISIDKKLKRKIGWKLVASLKENEMIFFRREYDYFLRGVGE